jgi:hypothetical protein
MKTNRIALLALAAFGIFMAGCDDFLSELLKFNTQWYPVEFSIYPSDEIGDIDLATDTIEADLDSLLDVYNISPENIRSIKVSDAKIYVLTNGYNFDPLTRAEIVIATDMLEEKMIAWIDTVPRDVTMVELKLTDDDLQDYLLESKFILKLRGYLESKVDQTVNMKANIRYVIRGDFGN